MKTLHQVEAKYSPLAAQPHLRDFMIHNIPVKWVQRIKVYSAHLVAVVALDYAEVTDISVARNC